MNLEYVSEQTVGCSKEGDVVLYKGETFVYYDEGLTRDVYVNEDRTKVIKFLKEPFYNDYNEQEYSIYEASIEKNKMAKTEISNGIIEQEFCEPIKFSDKRLTIGQRLFAFSCRGEVGWDKDGNLKCFDLSEFKKY